MTNKAKPDEETVEQYQMESGDFAEILLFIAGPDAFPVRLCIADADERATAWMTADEADDLAHRIIGVAERARREGRQA